MKRTHRTTDQSLGKKLLRSVRWMGMISWHPLLKKWSTNTCVVKLNADCANLKKIARYKQEIRNRDTVLLLYILHISFFPSTFFASSCDMKKLNDSLKESPATDANDFPFLPSQALLRLLVGFCISSSITIP